MWCSIMDSLEREIVATIQRVLSQVYPFVLRACKFISNQEVLNVRLATHQAPGADLRSQNRQIFERWPPFYSRIVWGPNGTLFCTSGVWGYSKLAIRSRRSIHYTSLCCSHMVNEYFYSKTNQMHSISNLFYFEITIYIFRTVFQSIIRSLRLYIEHQVYVIQVLWLLASKIVRNM